MLRPPATAHTTPSVSLTNGTLHDVDQILSTGDVADHSALDQAAYQFDNPYPTLDVSIQRSLLDESLTVENLLALEDYTLGQHQYSADVSVAVPEPKCGSWCDWMRQDVSLSVAAENPTEKSNANLLAVLQVERPHAQHSADLVIQSLRSFPKMMQRRETFPWFIHPHSQILSKSPTYFLPEALLTCMSIAQIFGSRTLETKPFLWRTIRAEYHRFSSEVRIYSAQTMIFQP